METEERKQMEYQMNQKALRECQELLERQYQKMILCYGQLEENMLWMSEKDRNLRERLKEMEEQLLEIRKLQRILERILLKVNQQEKKILEQLEGKQPVRNYGEFGKLSLGYLSEMMEEMQVWIH